MRRGGRIAALHISLCCIAASAAEARRAPLLDLRLRAVEEAPASRAPRSPRFMDAIDAAPGRAAEAGWGVPAAWLRGLAVDRTPLGLGSVALGYGSLHLRLDGQLRIAGTDAPLLGGRVELRAGARTVRVTLPWLQVWPRRQNGQLFVEVSAILIDRRF